MAALVPPRTIFHPSEEDLVGYYLLNKNLNPVAVGAEYAFTFIREFNLYGHSPYELPVNTCYSYGVHGSKRHWYCYTTASRVLDANEATRPARGGFWRGRGSLKSVMNRDGNAVIGTRRTFWFYVGNASVSKVETDWVLHEYSLVGHHQMPSFVVCRLFFKPDGDSVDSSGSQASFVYNFIRPSFSGNLYIRNQNFGNQMFKENGVHFNGNGNVAPDVMEHSLGDENLTDDEREDDAPVESPGRNCEPNNHVLAEDEAVPVHNSPHRPRAPLDAPSTQSVDLNFWIEPWTAEQYIAAILEGDFIECDDLVD